MRELQSRGLVVRRPGIGTRVVSKQTRRAFAHSLSSIEDVHQFATRTRLIDVSVEDVVADGPLAGRGDFRHGQKLLRAEALRVPVDKPESPPLSWTEIFVIDAYSGIRDRIGHLDGSVGRLIESIYGEVTTEIRQDIAASSAPPHMRSEERRVGKESVCQWRSQWSP